MGANVYDNVFCGREKELQLLKDKWKLVADSENQKPQIVVLTAEQGLGKTRLLQAFYEWLSQHEDAKYPDGYWPDTIGSPENFTAINPKYDQRQKELKLPWLWWG